MEASSAAGSSGALYRYRTGEFLSHFMRSDELRAHAAEGKIKPDSSIQRRGDDAWIPASRVPGLWTGAAANAPRGGTDATESAPEGGPAAEREASTTESAGTGNGGTHPHPARVGESMTHLLQRALLGHVTVSAGDWDQPLRAILAGVTVDSIALEFESSGTVVFVPWARIRSIGVPASHAHTTARIRTKAELLVIEVEHLPASVVQTVQPA